MGPSRRLSDNIKRPGTVGSGTTRAMTELEADLQDTVANVRAELRPGKLEESQGDGGRGLIGEGMCHLVTHKEAGGGNSPETTGVRREDGAGKLGNGGGQGDIISQLIWKERTANATQTRRGRGHMMHSDVEYQVMPGAGG